MAKKAKRFETIDQLDKNDVDYGLLPGLEHVAYMNPVPYIQKEKFGSDGAYTNHGHEKKLHKLLVR